ncbi:lysis protein [Hafnia alvei]|jgi:prophage endopeptidase|uniref:lysis protein n=2 Tax=Hafnia alvei TaxID=569 RepID=UPI00345EA251
MNINFSWRMMAIGVLLVALVVAGRIANHYRDKYHQVDKDRIAAEQLARERQSTINDMAHRQQLNAALDAKYMQELLNAKSQVETLRADLNSGTKRLRIAASCPKLPEATATTGKPDATSPRLNDSVERDYLSLVERIRQSETMINGLQSYIRNQYQ